MGSKNSKSRKNVDYTQPTTTLNIDHKTQIPDKASTSSKPTTKKEKQIDELEKLFERYKAASIEEDDSDEEDEDVIGGNGIIKFAEELGIDPMDVDLLIIVWKLNVQTQYKINRKEWFEGWRKYNAVNLQQMRELLPLWRDEIKDQRTFKKFYNYVFIWSREEGMKSVANEIARATWKLLLKDKYPYIDDWCRFMEEVHEKTISKDLWEQFYDFTVQVGSDWKKFDSDSAWPVAIDEFVEWYHTKRNEPTKKSEQTSEQTDEL